MIMAVATNNKVLLSLFLRLPFIPVMGVLLIFSCQHEKVQEQQLLSYELTVLDSVELSFPEHIPLQAGITFKVDSGYYYIIKNRQNKILFFDSVGHFVRQYGGVGNQPGQYPTYIGTIIKNDTALTLVTGVFSHFISLNNFKVGTPYLSKNLTSPGREETFTQYRVADFAYSGYYDTDKKIYILPIENNQTNSYSDKYYSTNTIGIFDRKGNLTQAFGHYPELYRQQKYLHYRKNALLAYDEEHKQIYSSFSGSATIYVYDLDGRILHTIEHRGSKITNHALPGISKEEEDKYFEKLWLASFYYARLTYNPYQQELYRIYAEDNKISANNSIRHLYNKPAHLEIFKDYKFVGEVDMPAQLGWQILACDSDNILYFAPKYYWYKEDRQKAYIYKCRLISTEQKD